ncbi:MAG TPA: GNAT family N-acetyltransferase [Acidimicrobiia bacterium]
MTTSTIVAADPLTDEAWLGLACTPRASLFTSPPWINAVCGTYGFTPRSVVAVDHRGEPTGGFAWVTIDDARGTRACSLPFSDRADPLVDDETGWRSLFDAADLGTAHPYALRCLDDSPAVADPRLRITSEAAWHGTPLDATPDELYRRISSASRRAIAVSERAGVRVEVRTDVDAVRSFHRLHVRLRKKKYRLLAQPMEFFERIWREFAPSDRINTLLACFRDEVIAGAVFLEWNGAFYYKFGASAAEHLAFRPNDAIYWTGIRCAIERGLGLVDWGLSDLDQPGLVAFKRKWASTERRLLTLRAGMRAPRPEQVRFASELSELTRLLTDETVPDAITTQAGALLYRYFC